MPDDTPGAPTPDDQEPAGPPFRAPRGVHDVLPPESARWEEFIARFASTVRAAGYGLVVGPTFEDLGVFQRMGEGTDVVTKEMYDFLDKGGRRIALRPEGTAGVVRAFVQHRPVAPWKVWYAAPNFRYEAPQAGRLRQHHQVGVEAIGSDDPDLDVEVIVLLSDFYRSLGLRQVDLVVNSMGSPADRQRYADALRSFLQMHRGDLDAEDRAKVDRNPLRVLDTKRSASQAVLVGAPDITEVLDDESRARFARVQAGLIAAGVDHRVDPWLVRGLDYYTHTTFEFQSGALDAAQSTIGGGGRYDGLVESLGGPPTPGIGFGCGIERVLLTCDAEDVFPVPDRAVSAYVVDLTGGEVARDVSIELRRAGITADRGYGARSMKSQMKTANRSGARFAVIIGEDELAAAEVTVRDLRADTPQQRVPRTGLVFHLTRALGSGPQPAAEQRAGTRISEASDAGRPGRRSE